MSFGLTTAINVEDVPLILRSAARNYKANAKNDKNFILEQRNLRRHYPELWEFAAQILEQCAEMLDSQIADVKSREPAKPLVKRAVL